MSEDVNPQPGDEIDEENENWLLDHVRDFHKKTLNYIELAQAEWIAEQYAVRLVAQERLRWERVERATPPAPDPDTAELIESAWRWRDEFANDLDGEIEENVTGLITSLTCEIERLAGLQAPPEPVADFDEWVLSTLDAMDAAEDLDAVEAVLREAAGRLQAPPVDDEPKLFTRGALLYDEKGKVCGQLPSPDLDDEPVGWANRYGPKVYGGVYRSAQVAIDRAMDDDCAEVAVPLYRRPGVQPPAAEPEWEEDEQTGDVYVYVDKRPVPLVARDVPGIVAELQLRTVEIVPGVHVDLNPDGSLFGVEILSPGVQSPPATPEPARRDPLSNFDTWDGGL